MKKIFILLLLTTCVRTSLAQSDNNINLLISNLPVNQETKRYKNYVEPRYKSLTQQSFYLTMRDGVKIAVQLVMPKDLPATEKIPAVLKMTRYWRAKQDEQFNGSLPGYGYATLFVDARGTGASYGIWAAPFSPDEIKDYNEVVNWIVKQTWSNGKVGAVGTSYTGNTALWLATTMNPAVKAVLPRHFEFDLFAETPYPGGVFADWLIKAWNEGNRQLDTNPGVKLVDEDVDQRMYTEAIANRSRNIDVYAAGLKTNFRDDREFGVSFADISLHAHVAQIEKSGVAINSWGGWFDASTADATIKAYLTLKNPHRAVVGPWNHGGSQNASPYQTATLTRVMQGYEQMRFFDYHLKGIDTGLDLQKQFFYFTIGEEKWKVTPTWPIAGTKMIRWYFNEDNLLNNKPATTAQGEDRYTVDFEATTGAKNRWHTQVGGQVVYPDRAQEDRKLLTYTSAPLESDLEITGYPVISLFVTSSHSDGAFFVYLEDVDENGKVTYLTEGQLRAIHRKVSNEKSPLKILVPYHTFMKKDAAPMVPSEVAELRFGLQPISVLLKKGHRLRVAIAGHDKDTFSRIPSEGTPTLAVQRNARFLSSIELPIIPR